MHPEPHHPAPHSLREFLGQYAMIVLSILTALGLEHVAVDWNDRARAAESRSRIEVELAQNIKELDSTLAIDRQTATLLRESNQKLATLLAAPAPDNAAISAIAEAVATKCQIVTPDLQTEAWETAIADQSASHIPPEDLRRYMRAYAKIKSTADMIRIVLGGDVLAVAAAFDVDRSAAHPDTHRLSLYISRLIVIDQTLLAGFTELRAALTSKPAP